MRILKLNLVALATILLIFSCSKEEFAINQELENESVQFVLDNIPIIANPNDVTLYTKNEVDPDDEKINLYLLDIAIATRDFLKESPQNQSILNRAKASAYNTINLLDIVSDLMSANQSAKYAKLVSTLEKADLTHVSTNSLKVGEIEEYVPAIYVPNAEIADFSKQPVVAVGFEVNVDISGMEEYEDNIVAWYYDEDGSVHEILLNEETVMNTTNPVFIINNAEGDAINRKKADIAYQSTAVPAASLKTNSGTEYASNEYQINYRYEGSGKSEFCITAAHIDAYGNVHVNLRRDNGYYDNWKQIAAVDKNDIGKLKSHWEQFISTDVTPHSSNYTFWNTFERDWYSSPKPLGEGSGNGKTVYLGGNMKYSGEWYAYDPDQVKYNRVDYNYVYGTWAKWHSNYKGKFRLWRVEL